MSPATQRFLAPAALAVIVLAGTLVFVTIPANAQVQRSAKCVELSSLLSPQSISNWMNLQIKDGKTDFIQAGSRLCAW